MLPNIQTAIVPSIIASLTTFAIFFIKDWLFTARQREVFAQRLLIHYLNALLRMIDKPPNDFDYLNPKSLEQYVDVYVKCKSYNLALDVFIECFMLWKTGGLTDVPLNTTDATKARLNNAIKEVKAVPIGFIRRFFYWIWGGLRRFGRWLVVEFLSP